MDKTKIAVDTFDKLAVQYQDKYMDVDLYDHTFDLFCDAVEKKNADIIEVACGPGNITRYLLKKRPDFKILGTDLAPQMVELAKINNPRAEFQIMDCRGIATMDKKYDAVMSGFCFPYLSKEAALSFIKDSATILNPGGVIYISTMEDDYSKSGFKGSSSTPVKIYMHYHERGYLIKGLETNDFEVITSIRQNYPDPNGEPTTDLIIIARKN
jgi:cyclopropane fatty-acyl-phospholipid synthase-like methyltransferase